VNTWRKGVLSHERSFKLALKTLLVCFSYLSNAIWFIRVFSYLFTANWHEARLFSVFAAATKLFRVQSRTMIYVGCWLLPCGRAATILHSYSNAIYYLPRQPKMTQNWKFRVPCSTNAANLQLQFWQAPNACFSRERCLLARVCSGWMLDYHFASGPFNSTCVNTTCCALLRC